MYISCVYVKAFVPVLLNLFCNFERQVGLCGNHAYSVLDVREIFDPRFMGRVWLSGGGAFPLDRWNKKSLGSRMGLYWVVYKMICVTLYFVYIHMMVRVSIHSYYNNILHDKWMKQYNGTDTWIYVGHFSIYARFPVGFIVSSTMNSRC